MTNKPRITRRTADRLIRAAYEYEHLAARLRADGRGAHAASLLQVSQRLGEIGRDLDSLLTEESR